MAKVFYKSKDEVIAALKSAGYYVKDSVDVIRLDMRDQTEAQTKIGNAIDEKTYLRYHGCVRLGIPVIDNAGVAKRIDYLVYDYATETEEWELSGSETGTPPPAEQPRLFIGDISQATDEEKALLFTAIVEKYGSETRVVGIDNQAWVGDVRKWAKVNVVVLKDGKAEDKKIFVNVDDSGKATVYEY